MATSFHRSLPRPVAFLALLSVCLSVYLLWRSAETTPDPQAPSPSPRSASAPEDGRPAIGAPERVLPGSESAVPIHTGLEDIPSVAAFLTLDKFFRDNRLREQFGPGFTNLAGPIVPTDPALKAQLEELAEAYTQTACSSLENLEAMIRFIKAQPDAGVRQLAFCYFLTWGGSRKDAPSEMFDPRITTRLLAELEEPNNDWWVRSYLASAVYNIQSSFPIAPDSVEAFRRILAKEENNGRVGLHLIWTLSNNFKQPEAREALKGVLVDLDKLPGDTEFRLGVRGRMISGAAAGFLQQSHYTVAETGEIVRDMLRSTNPEVRRFATNFMNAMGKRDPARPQTSPEILDEIGSLLEPGYRNVDIQSSKGGFVSAAKQMRLSSLDSWVPMVAGDEAVNVPDRSTLLWDLVGSYQNAELALRMIRSFAETSGKADVPIMLRKACVSNAAHVLRNNSLRGEPPLAGGLEIVQRAVRAAQESSDPELRNLSPETLTLIAGLQSPPR